MSRRLWLLSPALLALAIAASVLAWPHLPDQIPIDWGFSGQPSDPAPKGLTLAGLPVLMAWCGGIVGLIVWSTTRAGAGRATPAWLAPAATAATLGVLLLLHLALIANGLGWPVSVPAMANVGTGLLLIGVGRIMPHIPPNPAFGARTPRTLSDPAAWDRANRAGGRGFVIAGALTILAAPLPGGWPFAVMMTALLGACIVAVRAARAA